MRERERERDGGKGRKRKDSEMPTQNFHSDTTTIQYLFLCVFKDHRQQEHLHFFHVMVSGSPFIMTGRRIFSIYQMRFGRNLQDGLSLTKFLDRCFVQISLHKTSNFFKHKERGYLESYLVCYSYRNITFASRLFSSFWMRSHVSIHSFDASCNTWKDDDSVFG